ncbi:hypothetical protein L3V82_02730 [Thiotrichales bacterium 19S3-7]|nr:hypothetical protein [Thiotrichales bacterium 19S3-7]MCF6801084.1 hypothetical protein [Thiotrichales bacterium 19S3-11]
MLKSKTIQIKLIAQWFVIGAILASLVGCSFFRDREDDYLKTDIQQTQGIKVPQSLEKTTTIQPAMQVPKGPNQYQSVSTVPTDLVPPNYQKQYPLALLKNLQAQSAESSLTFVKGSYGLLVINAPLGKAYEIVAKELVSIPDFEVIGQSSTGHSFEVVSSQSQSTYWLYLTLKDNKTRLSVFDDKKDLIANEEVYSLLTQLNSRIDALHQGGDSNIQIQYPIDQLKLDTTSLTLKVLAPMPEAMTFFETVLKNLGYVITTKNDLKIITLSSAQTKAKTTKHSVEQFSFTAVNDQASSITNIAIKSLKPSKDTQSLLAQLSDQIKLQSSKTFITKRVSLLSVSSQLFVDAHTHKAALIVPLDQTKVWPKVDKAIKMADYHIIRSDKDKGFFFIATKDKADYQYLIYVRKIDAESNASLSRWLTFGLLTSEEGSKTYVQVFNKDGHLMPIEQTKALLLTLQNNL